MRYRLLALLVVLVLVLSGGATVLADAVDSPPNGGPYPPVAIAASKDYNARELAALLPYFPSNRDHDTFGTKRGYTLFVLLPESFGPGVAVRISANRNGVAFPLDAEVQRFSDEILTHYPAPPDGVVRVPVFGGLAIMVHAVSAITVKFETVTEPAVESKR